MRYVTDSGGILRSLGMREQLLYVTKRFCMVLILNVTKNKRIRSVGLCRFLQGVEYRQLPYFEGDCEGAKGRLWIVISTEYTIDHYYLRA